MNNCKSLLKQCIAVSIRKFKLFFILLLAFFTVQCQDDLTAPSMNEVASSNLPHQDTTSNSSAANKTSGVMMQGFYWNVPAGGNWWDTIKGKTKELANMEDGYGIDRIWLPPVSKAESGANSMGYDPYDYYDLGSYNQKGTTETRFGSKQELLNLISTLKDNNIKVMGDIVLNHRTGGAKEYNDYTDDSTYTDFSGVKSGKATWHWDSFHPTSVSKSDPGSFGDFPDVCYKCKSVTSDMEAWLNWLQNDIGFNGGWRFDYVKGIYPKVVSTMKHSTGDAFSVGEYFDGNIAKISSWINRTATNSTAAAHAFDFPLYNSMTRVFNSTYGSKNITDLINPYTSLAARNPSKAVTFVGNHDTDNLTSGKMLAYAFILTYQGYPCIWWKDYFNNGLATSAGKAGNGINKLVWVRGNLAQGNPQIELLKKDSSNLLVYESKGYADSAPGYIVAINDHPGSSKEVTVKTNNTYLQDQNLHAYAWYSSVSGENTQPENIKANASGNIRLSIPPRGYVIYSVQGF